VFVFNIFIITIWTWVNTYRVVFSVEEEGSFTTVSTSSGSTSTITTWVGTNFTRVSIIVGIESIWTWGNTLVFVEIFVRVTGETFVFLWTTTSVTYRVTGSTFSFWFYGSIGTVWADKYTMSVI
jgi:hypothetical protein